MLHHHIIKLILFLLMLMMGQAYALEKKYFVAVGQGDFNGKWKSIVYVSEDAFTWERVSFPKKEHPKEVIWANDQFIILTESGLMYVSENAHNWQVQKPNVDNLTALRWQDGQYIAFSSKEGITGIYTSQDGINFTSKLIGIDAITGFASNSQLQIGVGGNDREGLIVSSRDLINWQTQYISGGKMTDVIWANDQFVGVGYVTEQLKHRIPTCVFISKDGVNWKKIKDGDHGNSFPFLYPLNSIAWGAGRYVAVGTGDIQTSEDGETWTTRMRTYSSYYTKVIFSNGKFVAVGSHRILTSLDGISWKLAFQGDGNYIYIESVA